MPSLYQQASAPLIELICVVLARDQAWKANGSRGDKEGNTKTDAQGSSTSDSYEI
ncbi:hypothetical protein HanRHA438_Chr09g0394511 [Helianthus annuus]|nr:hypothetical protein HanHA300_Chr09g0314261 [Helianthus annuus]KAJ0542013.1 hypothetical protein HanHA89_Chr09g0335121 [Helianthus annuus]KAJ0707078.1 hypothetical protein HanLR1_Chr09g0314471 [Helianthus annuus]KAJ0711100.1 hypothetical protein HanOQP8_Chr09g0320061 [Helianthus annuus]KAJ0887756.1 hypothetical protein HanRHA438_Chr09g0394511 [Helianthus annuus]